MAGMELPISALTGSKRISAHAVPSLSPLLYPGWYVQEEMEDAEDHRNTNYSAAHASPHDIILF